MFGGNGTPVVKKMYNFGHAVTHSLKEVGMWITEKEKKKKKDPPHLAYNTPNMRHFQGTAYGTVSAFFPKT